MAYEYDRRPTEKRLFESRLYRALLDKSNDAIFLLQIPTGHVIDVNETACRQLGYTPQELLTLSLHNLVPLTTVEQIERLFSGEKALSEESVDITTVLYKKNGDEIPVELSFKLFTLPEMSYGAIVARDITERRQALEIITDLQEQLRQVQKLETIGVLVGGIAHDFNNILTAILGYTELVLELLPSDSPVRNDIYIIQQTAQRAAPLTQRLLGFARRQIVEPQITGINELIIGVDKMLRRIIGEDIELITLATAVTDQIKIDPGQLEQLLINLAVNARDAMPNGGKLIIKTSNVFIDEDGPSTRSELKAGKYVLLSVSDTGLGMTEEVKDHLFEPFFSTKQQGQGSGLGLTICLGIVKQSNGHIWVSSEPGHGTTFEIFLPCVEKAERQTVAPPPPSSISSGTETILLVENEIAIRNLTSRVLRGQGYTVLEAANGSEALHLVQEQADIHLDLLIADIVMPQMGGLELADRMRAKNPNLKIMFISGYTGGTFNEYDLLERGDAFLAKPFSPELLVTKIRQILDE